MFELDNVSASSLTLAVEGVAALVLLIVLLRLVSACLIYVPNTHYGIVERRWSAGRTAEPFGPIALRGNAGFLPDVFRGGIHVVAPFKYRVRKRPLINIDQIGYLVARVGRPLEPGQALGAWPAEADVDDARAFLQLGGQAGPQRRVLRSGTYAINTALFTVVTADAIHHLDVGGAKTDDAQFQTLLRERYGFTPVVIKDDKIGIVTVQDGPALQHGEIIAPSVGTDANRPEHFHNSFQDIGRFLTAGGRRGRQEQVLVEGTYFLNRLFATVEITGKTHIGIGTVGVINSFVGRDAGDTADAGRGRTVEVGQRGIWRKPLDPGKYAINPYAMEVISVPTTNFQLRWIAGVASAAAMPNGMSYDDDLKEIPVITRDAFEILVPLSIVAHIAPANAPHVIQRFSQIERLVNQTLDPFISSYFKDTAQQHTLLDFINTRSEMGKTALEAMKLRLNEHRIEIEEVMIGTPRPAPGDTRMEAMLEQLRLRQIAREEQKTFEDQKEAATKRKALNEQIALAEQQPGITRSELSIRIAENEGAAETARKRRAAEGIRLMAEAEGAAETARRTKAAEGIRVMADAEAHAARARAEAIGGPENLIRQTIIAALVDMVKDSKVPLVPSTIVANGEQNNGLGLPGLLLAMVTKDLGKDGGAKPSLNGRG